jgi:hypothetical protein
MKEYNKTFAIIYAALISVALIMPACGGKTNFLSKSATPLRIEEVDPAELNQDPTAGGGSPGGTPYQDIPSSSTGGLSPIFSGVLGMPISYRSLAAIAPDPSGYTAITDYDGDGIPNELEVGGYYNPYVSDCPRITARIDTPITMELRVSETDVTENHSEDITDTDVKSTINNSMESRQYNQLNKKTTPYVVKESQSSSVKDAGSEGYNMSSGAQAGVTTSQTTADSFGSQKDETSKGGSFSYSMNQNRTWDKELAQSSMSEKTVFEDVNYIDNLNRNGVEYKDDTVRRISKNFRQGAVSKSTTQIGPSAGYVRAGLYLANESKNQPVLISNVICTLSFRTPSGKCLPVKTFRLKNDDNTDFAQEVYGGEELGPYTINVENLNTFEVKNALRFGYNPGVDNLKIVEETAKARTAIIKIAGNGMRETYRVPAFDVDENGDLVPGVSLKKALFHIYASQTGGGERWDMDADYKGLTVPDTGLKWRADFDPGAAEPG